MVKLDCFIAFVGIQETSRLVDHLFNNPNIGSVYVLHPTETKLPHTKWLQAQNPYSTESIREIAQAAKSEYALLLLQNTKMGFKQFAIERFLQVAQSTNASMVYADYYDFQGEKKSLHPVIDYQAGSLRDDFDFGPAQLYKTSILKEFDEKNYAHAGYYALRLAASRKGVLYHIPEPLCTLNKTDHRESGDKQFDYVKANAREIQLEMEQACTRHLKKIGAFLSPPFQPVSFDDGSFPVEASVLIPVFNRANTIADAIESVLSQQTSFKFNLLVVDNHSTDGTTKILAGYAQKGKLIHIIPENKNLGIGGCWNEGIFSSHCGKFVVQLDSDDLYAHKNTLQKIIDQFYTDQCAMVIGSYQITNFALQEIPPGLISHSEWTDTNGPNNALRINGLGAPRAFYTPIIRQIKFPNVSYGEDYAVGINIAGKYKVGRIYESLYLCRRWEGNSDAALDIQKQNQNNTYKDSLRTIELLQRMKGQKK